MTPTIARVVGSPWHAPVLGFAFVLVLTVGRNDEPDVGVRPPVPDIQYRDGWSPEERDGKRTWRWMGGHGALRLRHQGGSVQLSLRGFVPGEPSRRPPSLSIRMDGREIDRFEAFPGRFARVYDLGRLPPRRYGHDLSIDVSSTVSAPPPDVRQLGLSVESIGWSRSE